jgi:hypothetical protein
MKLHPRYKSLRYTPSGDWFISQSAVNDYRDYGNGFIDPRSDYDFIDCKKFVGFPAPADLTREEIFSLTAGEVIADGCSKTLPSV